MNQLDVDAMQRFGETPMQTFGDFNDCKALLQRILFMDRNDAVFHVLMTRVQQATSTSDAAGVLAAMILAAEKLQALMANLRCEHDTDGDGDCHLCVRSHEGCSGQSA